MKKSITIITIITIIFSVFPKPSLAIEDPLSFSNNRFGIHILFPQELSAAAQLVNSSGGDWGYVTIPIQSVDRNLEKWQEFMDDAKSLHLIPIIRIATYPRGNFWTTPTIFDHLDFANFLNSLSWPVVNRYIIVYNEPNSNLEWGGAVDAAAYAQELSYTIDAFKRVNDDFFIISAGLDGYAPQRGSLYQNSYQFLLDIDKAVPGIFKRIDGFASHSYPGSNFSESPFLTKQAGITSYKTEEAFIKNRFGRGNIPIFITETGWQRGNITEKQVASFYQYAFENIWSDKNIVAITPFLLNGQASSFDGFSLLRPDGSPSEIFSSIALLPKVKGQPQLIDEVVLGKYAPPVAVKNFQRAQDKSFIIKVSPSWKAFLNWLFGQE